ncbi:MAG: hypothetical protein BMS9Abin34_213 [Patescibacteria group bacterium]|nr:MAG: hypothetical protein BMS9Abin34_213 [Patescibacteria group bacterium]
MDLAVDRKLDIAGRVAEQQARATIKRNPILALVELITNSDDSYRRLENAGFKADGRIIIELVRKHKSSILRVTDFAEGFDEHMMDERVGGYGEDTSGFTEESVGRGYWGRGLKEAMIAMGFGEVESIKDGFFHKCTLKNLNYKRTKPIKITEAIRADSGVKENGARVTLQAINKGIRIPRFETLEHWLEYYYSLRDIVSSSSRDVQLVEKDSHNKIKRQTKLSYIFPKGELYYPRKTINIPEFKDAKVEVEIYRSSEPLSGYESERSLRENGLLIRTKGAILDVTLTRKFEGSNYASRIFGHATCDYIDHLLRTEKEPVVQANRTGVDWTHPFSKALENVLRKEVEICVQAEEKRAKEVEKRLESEKTRKRYEASLPALNKIAKDELGNVPGEGEGLDDGKPQQLPPNGFDFMPDYVQIVVDKESTLTLKASVPKVVKSGSTAKIYSDTKEIIVTTTDFIFDENNANPDNGLEIVHVRVLGKQVGAEGVITAEVNGLKSEILVKVISRRKPPKPVERKRSGLFSDFDFSSAADPNQRVKFERANGKIVIATKAPSVATYFGLDGQGQEEGHCQVMLAELVIEAVCREIARKKIESGDPFLGEAAEAMNVVHNRLINRYAEKIHRLLVEKKYHR